MLSNELIEKFQIFSNYKNSSVDEMEDLLNVNRKYLFSTIEKINDILLSFGFSIIEVKDGRIKAPEVQLTQLFERMSKHADDYLFHEERLDMIVLYILLNKEFVSNNHLQNLLRMSKNSVLSDLKRVKQVLRFYQIELLYTRRKGYYLKASGTKKRSLLEITLGNLLSMASGSWVITYVLEDCGYDIEFGTISFLLQQLGEKYKINFISEKTREVSYLMTILNVVSIDGVFKDRELENIVLISQTSIGRLFEELIEKFPSLASEKSFLLSRLAACTQGNLNLNPEPIIINLMDKVISRVRANTGIEFSESKQFRNDLYAHLYPAYHRLVFDIPLNNPLKSQIIADFPSLYYLVKRSLSPLEEYVGKSLSEDEIAYFTIHFGGYLETSRKSFSNQKMDALIVCPNGISSSLMLQSELKDLFPDISFKRIHRLEQVRELDDNSYQMIFSTVDFKSAKPTFVLQPLMNPIEKMMLKRRVHFEFNIQSNSAISIENLVEIIGKNATIHNRLALIHDLSDYFIGSNEIKQQGGYGLLDLLTKDLIQQRDKVADWQEAIRVAALPLLQGGYIEESYIQGMVNSVRDLGPYIVLAPRVAVPHALPELGVKQLGMSLLQIKEAVNFDLSHEDDEEKQVQLVFVLAAVDSTAHLQSLQELAMVLDDEETIDRLILAKDTSQILEIISKTIEEGGMEND